MTFQVQVITLLQDIENFHKVRLQERLQIVWKQKHKSEHGTCDKNILTPPLILTPPSIRICPLFGELIWDFFHPPPSCPVWTNVSISSKSEV